MGKTQLAAAYAKRHRGDYSAVFWLNAKDETSLKQSFARVTSRIFREHPSIVYVRNAIESRDVDEAVQAAKRWLDQPKNDRWLMVYDNYDNPVLQRGEHGQPDETLPNENKADGDADAASKSYDIRPFLPDAYHGAILITTRSARVQIGRRIPLGKLGRFEDSLEILSHASGRQDLHEGT